MDSQGVMNGYMRVTLLSFLITIFFVTGPVSAQPVMEEATPVLIAPQQAPTLPDLTPDQIVKPAPAYQPPAAALDDGQSTVFPSLEPLQPFSPKRSSKKTVDEIFATLPYEIQTMILDETKTVNSQCHHYDIYSQFHDCECLGSRYFEERVFSPEESRDTIVGRLSGECTSIPGVAGYGYDQCMSAMRFVLIPNRMEEYCTCFANQLAENYKMSPYPDFGNLRALNSRTNTYCLQRVRSAIKGLP